MTELKPGLADEIRAVSTALVADEPPESEMLKTHMAETYRNGPRGSGELTQARIDQAIRFFKKMVKAIMPPELVRKFIKERCAQNKIPQMDPEMICIPVMSHMGLETVPPAAETEAEFAQAEWRADHIPLMTWEEAVEYLEACSRDGGIILAIRLAQQYIGDFIQAVIEEVPEDQVDLRERLRIFKRHWEGARNLALQLGGAMFLVMKKGERSTNINDINQSQIERAFEFLKTVKAFEKVQVIGGGTPSRPDDLVTIRCPAHAFLRDLFVQEGVLMLVIEMLKRIEDDPSLITWIDGYLLKMEREKPELMSGPLHKLLKNHPEIFDEFAKGMLPKDMTRAFTRGKE